MLGGGLFFLVALLCDVAAPSESPDPGCAVARNEVVFSVRSKRNESGDWDSTLEGRRSAGNGTDQVAMDFKHRVVECGGKQIFHFEAIFGGEKISHEINKEGGTTRLFFHPNCGTNVAITNKGRTIQKINSEDKFNGVAYTNRPLRPNELFEVTVNKRMGSKFGCFMGIGVTTTTPYEGNIIHHINYLRPKTWVMYHNNVYINSSHILKNRQHHLDQLKVGDRVGVKRTESGALLLLVNGQEDAVASNIPESVYGVFECYGDFSQVTITP